MKRAAPTLQRLGLNNFKPLADDNGMLATMGISESLRKDSEGLSGRAVSIGYAPSLAHLMHRHVLARTTNGTVWVTPNRAQRKLTPAARVNSHASYCLARGTADAGAQLSGIFKNLGGALQPRPGNHITPKLHDCPPASD